jgi:Uncharacterized protein conserved in bacteria
MKFLIDAQLPRRFCAWLRDAGHDATHTLDLAQGNRTPDVDLIEIAVLESRIVVTKDDDFVQSFLVLNRPERLLLIATGNIGNAELERLIQKNLDAIVEAFRQHRFVEIGRDVIVIHE